MCHHLMYSSTSQLLRQGDIYHDRFSVRYHGLKTNTNFDLVTSSRKRNYLVAHKRNLVSRDMKFVLINMADLVI